jgi:hypothetical protein
LFVFLFSRRAHQQQMIETQLTNSPSWIKYAQCLKQLNTNAPTSSSKSKLNSIERIDSELKQMKMNPLKSNLIESSFNSNTNSPIRFCTSNRDRVGAATPFKFAPLNTSLVNSPAAIQFR